MKESFTIIELLVVISIISILVSMLASTFARAKLAGQKGACQANARTIKSLNLIGVPVIYPQDYAYPFWSPYEGKEGNAELSFPYGRKETVLFVNCFDCHNKDDPFDHVHSLITIY